LRNFYKFRFRIRKVKKIDTITFLVFIFSLFWSKEFLYLFYNSTEGPDVSKYLIYIDSFFENKSSGRDHGFLYYYLHAIYLDINNFNYFLNRSYLDTMIQNVNFLIYIYGLIGYYKLLKFFKFKNNYIFLTLFFLNFFPPLLALRLSFKPEILAFSLLPWIILLLEKYTVAGNARYLYLTIPFLVSILSLKGNIFVITTVYLLIFYIQKIFLKEKKIFLYAVIFSILIFSFLTLENNKFNSKSLFDIQSGSEEELNYNFKASPTVTYKVDLFKLFSSPIKHNHANSFIAITLLETNGDYFDLFWDNNSSGFFKDRIDLVNFYITNKIAPPTVNLSNYEIRIPQQNNTDVYVRETLGFIISTYLFFMLLKGIFFEKKFKKFYYGVIVGMAVLLFHSISGIPKNNFDPNVGDTFKPLYYSFVMVLSFVFLIIKNLEVKRNFKYLLFVYPLLIFFILGFPKNYSYEIQKDLVPKVTNSQFCEFEKNYFLDNSNFYEIECVNKFKENNSNTKFEIVNHKPINLLTIIALFVSSIYLLFKKIE